MTAVDPPDGGTRPQGTSTLAKIARSCVRHRWIVIGAWVALLVGHQRVRRCRRSRLPDRLHAARQRDEGGPGPARGQLARPGRLHVADRDPRRAGRRRSRRSQATMEELFAYVDGIDGHHRHQPVRQPAADQRGRHDRLRPARHRRHPDVRASSVRSATRSIELRRRAHRRRGPRRSSTAATCSPSSSSPRARSTASSPPSSS